MATASKRDVGEAHEHLGGEACLGHGVVLEMQLGRELEENVGQSGSCAASS